MIRFEAVENGLKVIRCIELLDEKRMKELWTDKKMRSHLFDKYKQYKQADPILYTLKYYNGLDDNNKKLLTKHCGATLDDMSNTASFLYNLSYISILDDLDGELNDDEFRLSKHEDEYGDIVDDMFYPINYYRSLSLKNKKKLVKWFNKKEESDK